mmetsp:Transcript_67979/g.76112  ORF Transcript_67979/g.76112 Transcript_67979/m.76112 type:complete len:110 (-) Transcript_67979:79-408(-)
METTVFNTIFQKKSKTTTTEKNDFKFTVHSNPTMMKSRSTNSKDEYATSYHGGGLSYISPILFYTQSSTKFFEDGTFHIEYDFVFLSRRNQQQHQPSQQHKGIIETDQR